MTLNEMTSTIRNRIKDGLDGQLSNDAISLQQLEEEVDLVYAMFVNKYLLTSKLNRRHLMQTLTSICIKCGDVVDGCNLPESGLSTTFIKLPNVIATPDNSAVEYLGLIDNKHPFKVYFDISDLQNHKFRFRTGNKPYVFLDLAPDANGLITAYFYNMTKYGGLKFVNFRGMFQHPSRVKALNPQYSELEYPAPLHLQEAIIEELIRKYTLSFRQLNVIPQPNTQNDIQN